MRSNEEVLEGGEVEEEGVDVEREAVGYLMRISATEEWLL